MCPISLRSNDFRMFRACSRAGPWHQKLHA
ncbi:Uncharacterised protein [Bordetella pertussis]|nr:Uncharacterised protein [Bordetella pertussis]